MQTNSQLFSQMKPQIVALVREILGGGASAGSVAGGSGGGGLVAHEMAGVYHTGEIGRSQATWVATDITAGINSHALLQDVHHARAHGVLTSDHVFPNGDTLDVIGYTATNVGGKLTPRSSSGTTSVLLKTDTAGTLQVNRLVTDTVLDFGSTARFNRTGGYLRYEGTDNFYIVGTVPQTLLYSPDIYMGPSTGGSTTHLRANGLDSDDGDYTYTLGRAAVGHLGYTDYAGFAHRDRASVGNYMAVQHSDGSSYFNSSSGKLTTHAIGGSTVFQTSASRINPAGSMAIDIGDYNRKWRTGFFAELYVENLVAQDVIATIGGRIMVAPTTKLIADFASGATFIDVEHNNLVNGEYIYMASAPGGVPQIEAMKVTSEPIAFGGGWRMFVSRNLDGTGANNWVIGDAVVSLGSAPGHGYIDITSTKTILNHFGPTITHYVRTGTAAWNNLAPVVTSGNLRSFVDYTGDEFGTGAGNDLTLTPATGFKGYTLDRTNGLRLFNTHIELYTGGSKIVELNQTNGLTFAYGTGALNKVRWFSGGNQTLEMGAYDYAYNATTYSSALIASRPKNNSGARASVIAQVQNFAGSVLNQMVVVDDGTNFDKQVRGYGGVWAYENNSPNGVPLEVEQTNTASPLIWFRGTGINDFPQYYGTAGSVWGYIVVKIGNVDKKLPLYNL